MNQDVIESIGAVRREVRDTEHDGRPARALLAERTYDSTIDDVWDALTNRERIPRWLAPISGDLELGGRYQLEGNAGGEVTTCEPPTHLAVTWEFGGGVTWVDVRLSDDPDGGTRLLLEHVALADDLAMWDQFGPGGVGIGWDLSLLGLAEHLRTGAEVDIDAEVAASEAGVELMTRSSEAWCEADIAFGTPEADARARAAATTAAYTGGTDVAHDDSANSANGADGADAGDGAGEPDTEGPPEG